MNNQFWKVWQIIVILVCLASDVVLLWFSKVVLLFKVKHTFTTVKHYKKVWTPQKIVEIILKFEQIGFTMCLKDAERV